MNNEIIKQARLSAGLTQKKAAKIIGISERTLQNIESGKSIKTAQYYTYMITLYSERENG